MSGGGFAVAAIVASTAFSAFAQKNAADEQATSIELQGKKNAEVAEFNADNLVLVLAKNAAIAERNAALFDRASVEAIQVGASLAGKEKDRARRAIGTFRARGASSGFAIDTGTQLDLTVQEAGFGAINAGNVITRAANVAYGFKQSAASVRESAEADLFAGELEVSNIRKAGEAGQFISATQAASTRTAGTINAISAISGGISSIALNRASLGIV